MLFGVMLDLWDFFWIMVIVTIALSGLSVYLKPKDRLRLKRIEAKLDQLLHHSGLTFDPFAAAPPGVLEAFKRGDMNEAAKLYRKATGSTFNEAFEYVEDLKKLSQKT
jgi:hypothetical protein